MTQRPKRFGRSPSTTPKQKPVEKPNQLFCMCLAAITHRRQYLQKQMAEKNSPVRRLMPIAPGDITNGTNGINPFGAEMTAQASEASGGR